MCWGVLEKQDKKEKQNGVFLSPFPLLFHAFYGISLLRAQSEMRYEMSGRFLFIYLSLSLSSSFSPMLFLSFLPFCLCSSQKILFIYFFSQRHKKLIIF